MCWHLAGTRLWWLKEVTGTLLLAHRDVLAGLCWELLLPMLHTNPGHSLILCRHSCHCTAHGVY